MQIITLQLIFYQKKFKKIVIKMWNRKNRYKNE